MRDESDYPPFFRLFYKVWLSFSVVLGYFVSRILLLFIFFVIVTPTGLIMRLVGKDPMERKLDPSAESYWIKREEHVEQNHREIRKAILTAKSGVRGGHEMSLVGEFWDFMKVRKKILAGPDFDSVGSLVGPDYPGCKLTGRCAVYIHAVLGELPFSDGSRVIWTGGHVIGEQNVGLCEGSKEAVFGLHNRGHSVVEHYGGRNFTVNDADSNADNLSVYAAAGDSRDRSR